MLKEDLGRLTRLREVALVAKQVSAAVQAEALRGKAAGLYEDRLRLTSGPSDEELVKATEELFDKQTTETIRAALGDSPQRALSLSKGADPSVKG